MYKAKTTSPLAIRPSLSLLRGTFFCVEVLRWMARCAVGCGAICQLQSLWFGKMHQVLGLACPPPPKHTPLPQPPSMAKSNAMQHAHAWMHCTYCGMGRSFGCGLQHKLGCGVPTLHPLLFTQPGHAATTLNLIGAKYHAHLVIPSQTQVCWCWALWLCWPVFVGQTKQVLHGTTTAKGVLQNISVQIIQNSWDENHVPLATGTQTLACIERLDMSAYSLDVGGWGAL